MLTPTAVTSVSVQTRGKGTRVSWMLTSVTGSETCLTWAVRMEPRVSTCRALTRVPVPLATMVDTVEHETRAVAVGLTREALKKK